MAFHYFFVLLPKHHILITEKNKLVISSTTRANNMFIVFLRLTFWKPTIAGISGMAAGLLYSHLREEIFFQPTRWMLSCCCWCCIGSYKVFSSIHKQFLPEINCGNICSALWDILSIMGVIKLG